MPRSSFMLAGPGASAAQSPPASRPSAPPQPPQSASADPSATRAGTLTALAGVGLLLLAMGVGVLIGRAGGSKQSAPQAQVITVGAAAGTGASAEASFTSDWPSGTKGYTVQLETLPQSGTSVAAVASAKARATTKGATSVGALKSDEFSSLTAGEYVIYSGVYPKKAEAEKAKATLKKSFPGASVIDVSNHSSTSEAAESAPPGSGKGVGESLSKPAPPSVLKSLNSTKGKSYEEKSKNLPNVIETG